MCTIAARHSDSHYRNGNVNLKKQQTPVQENISSRPFTCYYMYTGKENSIQKDDPFTNLL